jgi:hypothetical protein
MDTCGEKARINSILLIGKMTMIVSKMEIGFLDCH